MCATRSCTPVTYQHVLRLGHHRLEVARVVALDGLDLGVGRELHVRRAKERRARVAARDGHDHRVHHVLDERTRDHDADVRVDVLVLWHGDVAAGGVLNRALLVERLDLHGLGVPRRQLARGGLGVRFDCFAVGVHAIGTRGRVRHLGGTADVATTDAARLERLAPGDAHVAVRLLVVDEGVARELGLGVGRVALGGVHLGRLEHVKLADLRVAREHLHRVLVCAPQNG